LIGNHNGCEPAEGQQPDGLDAAGNKFKFGSVFDIIRRIVVDRTVAVQKNYFFQ